MNARPRTRSRRRTHTALVIGVVLLLIGFAWSASTGRHRARRKIAPTVSPPSGAPVTSMAGSSPAGSIGDAREAALRLVASSGALVRSGPIGRGELLRRLFTADAAARQSIELDHEADVLAIRLGVNPALLVWVEQPLTAQAEPSAGGVRVSVWSVVVFGTDAAPTDAHAALLPTVLWRTSVIDLVWHDGVWQASAMTATPGPTPALDDAAAVDGFVRFSEVAGWPAAVAGVGR